MNRSQTVSLAAMLAVLNGFAQQPKPAYLFKTILSTGATVGGHRLSPTATFEGVGFNDASDVAFVVHWIEADRERSAVFTSKRFIAGDGDTLDGKPISRINGTALNLNSSGQVAFEAVYGNPAQTGIFVDRKFILALSVSGSNNDFSLNDDGSIVLNAATAAPVTPTPAPGAHPATTNNTELQRGVGLKVPRAVAGILYGTNSPIRVVNPDVLLQPKPPSTMRPPQSPQQAKSFPTPPVKPCAVPEFPIPAEWVAVGTDMKGPIASHIFDAPAKNRIYESRFFGPMGAPFRVIQFSADCKPLLIIVGDNFLKGRFEIWTPNGLFSRTVPENGGFLDLKGFTGRVLPDQLVRSDTPLRINRHGQVLVPVNFEPDGYALLLGTPTPTTGSR
jgi:hypothetical protein